MDIAKKIVKYIGITQPKLEKLANFQSKLKNEIDKAYRLGLCSEKRANEIIKQASEDPSSIFSILTFPTVNKSFGTLSNTNTSSYDPLGNWMRQ